MKEANDHANRCQADLDKAKAHANKCRKELHDKWAELDDAHDHYDYINGLIEAKYTEIQTLMDKLDDVHRVLPVVD